MTASIRCKAREIVQVEIYCGAHGDEQPSTV